MTDLTQRLRELAEALVGCEWELPLCSRETCLRAADEIERLRDAVLFFSKHYDGPPDNMLCEREREMFQVLDEIKATGGE